VYKSGGRELCGETLPDGLRENDPLPQPIITPTTKAKEGHDEDISGAGIVAQGLVPAADYRKLEAYALALFARGTQLARERGLILVDTKYEFGKIGNRIYLIDEVHTPDSSRYFYAEGYSENQAAGRPQKHLSKEFVREWLISNGFQGHPGQTCRKWTMTGLKSSPNVTLNSTSRSPANVSPGAAPKTWRTALSAVSSPP
jgi:phosphoribosylaminoimidazole-succinocarboxamide synthase